MSKGAPGDRRRSAGALLRRIALDFSPLRASRDFRLIEAGQVVSGIGSQIALVALPTQIFLLSHSAALVGLLGLFELGPMVVASLLGGAVVDRVDRRNVLIAAQFIAIAAAGALAAVTLATHPPAIVILILGGLLAGSSALDNVTRAAIVPRVVPADRLRSALAFNYGAYQLTGIVGPAVGGILIATIGLGESYLIDAVSCLAMLCCSARALRPAAGRRRGRHRGTPADPPVDRRGPAVRAPQPGAVGQLRDRPRGDDVRLAAVDVRRALAHRLPLGQPRHRAAVRGARRRRDAVGPHRRLDRARAAARADRDRGRASSGARRSPARGSSARSAPRWPCSSSPASPTG